MSGLRFLGCGLLRLASVFMNIKRDFCSGSSERLLAVSSSRAMRRLPFVPSRIWIFCVNILGGVNWAGSYSSRWLDSLPMYMICPTRTCRRKQW